MLNDFSTETPNSSHDHLEIREELGRILESSLFRRSLVLARLLSFLVEQNLEGGRTLKETYIGHVLYRRDATYDPRLDSLVRVNANRLRLRLEEYYSANPEYVVRIEIPRGSYTPVYRWIQRVEAEAPRSTADVLTSQPPDVFLEQAPTVQIPESLSGRRIHGSWSLAGVAVAMVIFTVCSLGLSGRRQASNQWSTSEWKTLPFSRLDGTEEFPAFSPDGNRIAFSWTHNASVPHVSSVFVQDLRSSTPIRLTYDEGENTRPAWSPDGSQVAFIHRTASSKQLRIIRLKDRRETKVADLQGSFPWLCEIPRISWSRDGAQLFTANSATPDGPCGIIAIDLRTEKLQSVTQPEAGVVGDLEPAVAPTGERVAFIRSAGTLAADIYSVDRPGGKLTRITHDERDIIGFCWDSVGEGFLLASRREDGVGRLWHASLAGTFVRLSQGSSFPAFPSMSSDGKQIVVSLYRNLTSIWRVSRDYQDRLIGDTGSDGDAQTSPDGKRIVFRSDRTGSFELWLANRDGSNLQRLTYFNGAMVNGATWSPDGRVIAFQCRDKGNTDICTISSNGGPVRHLTDWNSEQALPSWSSNSQAIFFTSNHSGRPAIYKVDHNATHPDRVTEDGDIRAVPIKSSGLLVSRLSPRAGIYCGPVGPTLGGEARCPANSLLEPLDPEQIRGMWDAAGHNMWLVRSTVEDTSELEDVDLITRKRKYSVRLQGKLIAGDRALSVEADGNSVLITKQDQSGAELDLFELTRSPVR